MLVIRATRVACAEREGSDAEICFPICFPLTSKISPGSNRDELQNWSDLRIKRESGRWGAGRSGHGTIPTRRQLAKATGSYQGFP